MDSSNPYHSPNSNEAAERDKPPSRRIYLVFAIIFLQIASIGVGLILALAENKVIALPKRLEAPLYYAVIPMVVGIFVYPILMTAAVFCTQFTTRDRVAYISSSTLFSFALVHLLRYGVP